jgi:transcriptional regulator with XRE-family HTH domain
MSADVVGTRKSLAERVGQEIRVLMLRRGVTGERLARELGTSAAWVSYRLSGKQPIDMSDLERIASVLGVEPIALLQASELGTTLRYTPPPVRPPDARPATRAAGGPGRTGRTSRSRDIGHPASVR